MAIFDIVIFIVNDVIDLYFLSFAPKESATARSPA